MSKISVELAEVRIDKIVPGGQGLGILPSGKTIFVWNALPGEFVRVRVTKQRRNYAEGIAEDVIEASPERIEPREENYLATSPWQIISYTTENRYKNNIVRDLVEQDHLGIPVADQTVHDERQWHYRNKMEYSFWGDDEGLHLALHTRGSHNKHIVLGSKLAMTAVDIAANKMCDELNTHNIRGGDLKTIVVRCDQAGNAVAALFVRPRAFKQLQLPTGLQGLRVYYSDPKSPASVPTKLLYEIGDCHLSDELLSQKFAYDVDSFFQINVPIYEQVLSRIREVCQADPIDMYAGVGSIGLTAAKKQVTLVELHGPTAVMTRENVERSSLQAEVVEASTENALDHITADSPVIFDPPRAGLHRRICDRLIEVKPPQIIYLSCNPATQMRDLALLQEAYDIAPIEVFNFFPRTPHIETLAILTRKP